MHFHLFGNPAILKFRIRGFASPDYSGFALSEYFSIELVVEQPKQKERSSSAEDERSCVSVITPVAKMHFHLFGNPAILKFRIRGFASPDYSGFALSEYFLTVDLTRCR